MKIIKNIIYLTLYIARNFISLFYNLSEVSVLCYHDISENNWDLSLSKIDFEKQIIFLKNSGYSFLTINEIVQYILGKKKLPNKAVAVTFDDGYEGVYINAFPILLKYQIPATIFIVSEQLNFKSKYPLLNDQQIATMTKSGLVQIGHHSLSHQKLSLLNTQETKKELKNSLNLEYFAYPGGNYSSNVIKEVESAGFKAAFSIKPGMVNVGENKFLIKRNVILRNMSLFQFKLRVTRTIEWYRAILRFIR